MGFIFSNKLSSCHNTVIPVKLGSLRHLSTQSAVQSFKECDTLISYLKPHLILKLPLKAFVHSFCMVHICICWYTEQFYSHNNLIHCVFIFSFIISPYLLSTYCFPVTHSILEIKWWVRWIYSILHTSLAFPSIWQIVHSL